MKYHRLWKAERLHDESALLMFSFWFNVPGYARNHQQHGAFYSWIRAKTEGVWGMKLPVARNPLFFIIIKWELALHLWEKSLIKPTVSYQETFFISAQTQRFSALLKKQIVAFFPIDSTVCAGAYLFSLSSAFFQSIPGGITALFHGNRLMRAGVAEPSWLPDGAGWSAADC